MDTPSFIWDSFPFFLGSHDCTGRHLEEWFQNPDFGTSMRERSRGKGIRTLNHWFWRPPFYHSNYSPSISKKHPFFEPHVFASPRFLFPTEKLWTHRFCPKSSVKKKREEVVQFQKNIFFLNQDVFLKLKGMAEKLFGERVFLSPKN